jgi:glycine hydroxymethyltransferase
MRAVSGGTDTHLALVDLRPIGVTGDQAETRCDAARITLNKNAIPYDPAPPLKPSGLRVGSPSVTTQGMVESDMAEVGSLLARAVKTDHSTPAGNAELAAVADAVSRLVARAPAYPRP